MGIEKYRDGLVRAKVNGETIPSLSALAQQLPLVLMDTEGLTLLTGAPEGRRRLLDGTLFHVEQGFLALWKRYAHLLRQRNSGLRRGILSTDKAWRHELAQAGEQLTQARGSVVGRYTEKLRQLAPAISPNLAEVEMAFRAGWDRRESLQAALEKNAQSDAAQGFTQVGPHRADLRFNADGATASEVLSRGQMKLLLVALKLSQGQIIEEASKMPPLYLIDDLPAELDEAHCASVCAQLRGGRQVIMTAVDRASLERAWGADPINLFHVEQGGLTIQR
jgi:DNA replication and repair protein RecF